MRRFYVPFSLLTLLSGCTLMDGSQYTEKTVNAIESMESNVYARLDSMEVTMNEQAAYIANLEKDLANIAEDMDQMRQQNNHVEKNQQVALAAAPQPKPNSTYKGSIVLGSREWVVLDSVKQGFEARVDTGAATSSLNAIDIQEFERNGKNWARFHLSDKNIAPEDRKWIEAPIIRHIKIRQASSDGLDRRPVIELWIKLGDLHEKTLFTLADRSHMTHPILLGREFFKDIALVDVSKDFIQSTKPNK